MEYKELLEIIRDNFPEESIRIHEETYINTNYPLIYIKPKNYSIEIKNQRIGTITIPDKWQLKLPAESDFISSNILKIPDQNIKEFIILAGQKLIEYESLQLQWTIFHTSLNDLKTNTQAQIRDFKLKQLIKNESPL
jgi:hypothetical protein